METLLTQVKVKKQEKIRDALTKRSRPEIAQIQKLDDTTAKTISKRSNRSNKSTTKYSINAIGFRQITDNRLSTRKGRLAI